MCSLWTRAPLTSPAFAPLPPGRVRARGWLLEQLRLSADGLTGRLMEHWDDVGPQSGWLGGPGENWERGPYYVRGLVALAHTLGDPALIARAQPWIEWSLGHPQSDGFFGPADNDDWWPRMPMLEALRWHHEATGDARVLPLMQGYFAHQRRALPARPLDSWGKPRGGDNLHSVLWLFERTGEAALLDLADLLLAQTSDWTGEFTSGEAPSTAFDFAHGVNRAMGFKQPALRWWRSGERRSLEAVRVGWEQTLRWHGQIQGTYSGDEFLHGTGSTQGTELCTVVELLSSFETALLMSGEPWVADAIERLAFNALPAMLSADHRAHQYFQLPNQIECTPGARHFNVPHGTDLLFGLLSGYPCCAANLHMGWPRLTNHLWLATPDGGLAAAILAPCEVAAEVAGRRLTIIEDTTYPFGEEVHFIIRCAEPIELPLHLRLPAWAEPGAELAVNGAIEKGAVRRNPGAETPTPGRDGRFVRIHRRWRDGDTIALRLPMTVRCSRWERGSIGIERGPLVYALRIDEDWRRVGGSEPFCDYEVHPRTPWNYGLRLDPDLPEAAVRIERVAPAAQPWAQDGAGVRLQVPAQRLPEWQAEAGVSGPIPDAGLAPATAAENVTLIPFGCARLRIAMFPLVDGG